MDQYAKSIQYAKFVAILFIATIVMVLDTKRKGGWNILATNRKLLQNSAEILNCQMLIQSAPDSVLFQFGKIVPPFKQPIVFFCLCRLVS